MRVSIYNSGGGSFQGHVEYLALVYGIDMSLRDNTGSLVIERLRRKGDMRDN